MSKLCLVVFAIEIVVLNGTLVSFVYLSIPWIQDPRKEDLPSTLCALHHGSALFRLFLEHSVS